MRAKTKTTHPPAFLLPGLRCSSRALPSGWISAILDAAGQVLHEGPILNDRVALTVLLTQYPAAAVALEAGTHSPWIGRDLTGLGAGVVVVNPRRLQAISRHERKRDRRYFRNCEAASPVGFPPCHHVW